MIIKLKSSNQVVEIEAEDCGFDEDDDGMFIWFRIKDDLGLCIYKYYSVEHLLNNVSVV